MIELFLKKEADINIKIQNNGTTLYKAVNRNYKKIIQLFLNKNTDIHAENETILFIIIKNK
jgi:hypothetical protein